MNRRVHSNCWYNNNMSKLYSNCFNTAQWYYNSSRSVVPRTCRKQLQ